MAYPTGSGSECLFRGTINAQSNDPTAFRWDRTDPTLGVETYTVPALHIITLLSVTICDQNNSGGTFQMYFHNGASSIWVLEDQAVELDGTFVFNDKMVLIGGDKIIVDASSGNNFDIWYSFIDQDWS
jgi:hypothetical protein